MLSLPCPREERRKNRRLKKMGLTEEEEMAYRYGGGKAAGPV